MPAATACDVRVVCWRAKSQIGKGTEEGFGPCSCSGLDDSTAKIPVYHGKTYKSDKGLMRNHMANVWP